MSNSMKYGILAFVLVTALGMVWLLGSNDPVNSKKGKTYVSSKWEKHYDWADKDAYGLILMHGVLKDRMKGAIPGLITNSELLDSISERKEKYTLVFIGKEFGLFDRELDSIFAMVERGSDLFVSSMNITENFATSFEPKLSYRFEYSPTVQIQMDTAKYNFLYEHQKDTLAYSWHYIHKKGPVEAPAKSLSTIHGRPNFIEIPHGAGSIYIHSTPELFYNYNLAKKDGFFHAERLVKNFDPNKKLCYLELARLDESKIEEEIFEDDDSKGKEDDSYLQFLLRTPSLRIAMLLTILGIFLFVLFRTKRMQPKVDVIPQKRNISSAFVQTVASIYRSKDNPYSMLQLMRKNFYGTILKHYFVDLSKRTDHREIQHLSSRSNIPMEEIEALLNKLETSTVSIVNEDYLVETAKMKRTFYVQAGIISEKILNRLNSKEINIYRSIWLSFPLILAGILITLAGLYLLVQSNGVGIVLWPIGSFILAWGILRISKPLVKIDAEKIHYYPLMKRKISFKHDDMVGAKRMANGVEISFVTGQNIFVSKSEIDSNSEKQLEQFLLRKQIIEL